MYSGNAKIILNGRIKYCLSFLCVHKNTNLCKHLQSSGFEFFYCAKLRRWPCKGPRAKDGDRVLYRDNWRFDHDFLSLKNLSSLDKYERIVSNVRLSCLNFTLKIFLKTVEEFYWFIKKKVRSNLLPANFSSLHNINNNYISLSEGQPSSWCSSWWRLYWGMVFDFFRQYNLLKKRKLILSLNEWMV